MRLVLKFGGSSVDTLDKIYFLANKIIEYNEEEIVVVVSAFGNISNELIKKATTITTNPIDRELALLLATGEISSSALLSIVLNSLGQDSIVLQPYQLLINTNSKYLNSSIISIESNNLIKHLLEKRIVIIPGNQGINNEGFITKFGIDGSDVTATFLAHTLKCPCIIHTDVDGVYEGEPKITNFEKIDEINYYDLLLLSLHGAKIISPSAISYASKHQVPLIIKSIYSNNSGTVVVANEKIENRKFNGISILDNIIIIKLKDGLNFDQLVKLSENGIKVDILDFNTICLYQTIYNYNNLVLSIIKSVFNAEEYEILYKDNIGKISILGEMFKKEEVGKDLIEYLKRLGFELVKIKQTTNRLTVFVKKEELEDCVRTIYKFIK